MPSTGHQNCCGAKHVEPSYFSTSSAFCVLYATRHQTCLRFETDDMIFASTLIRNHSHTDKHTQGTQGPTSRLIHTHKYIINNNCYVHTAATFTTLNEYKNLL